MPYKKLLFAIVSVLFAITGFAQDVYTVKNPSFDFPKPLMGWSTQPARVSAGIFMSINQSSANSADPKFLRVRLEDERVALVNEGFDGMAFQKDAAYRGTLRYRQLKQGVAVSVELTNASGATIGRSSIDLKAADMVWQELPFTVHTTDTAIKGKLRLHFQGRGQLDIDRVSLFPSDTWKGRPRGLRSDLAQKLADLHPGFLRFPGGCIVEGKDIAHRYQWKKTIGPMEERQLIKSIWNDDVPQRQSPDYFDRFGLGFYEYFQLCEDIGAAPMPIINCGLSCQIDAAEVVPLEELDPYIQDALDLIEFANGDVSTTWGAKRAALGHPASFNMQLLGVGNENWGPQYAERLLVFTRASISTIHRSGFYRMLTDMTIMTARGQRYL